MRIEDILNMQMGGQQSYGYDNINVEKLDEFIDRACKKEDLNLQMLYNELNLFLQRGHMISLEHQAIYPHVLKRIEERARKGEK
jgi:hypothetical protein